MTLTCIKCKKSFVLKDVLKTSVKWYNRGLKYGFDCNKCHDDFTIGGKSPAEIPDIEFMLEVSEDWKKFYK